MTDDAYLRDLRAEREKAFSILETLEGGKVIDGQGNESRIIATRRQIEALDALIELEEYREP